MFGGNEELGAFIHRALGYSLTGETGEQCLFLCYGTGSNGKGTLLNTIRRDVLGDYGHALAFSTIEHDPRPGAQSNELAALLGRRFVVSSETNEGRRINEGRIKWLTGCDPIRARFLYAESFEFQPVAKFWLAVNHRPKVTDTSQGFWRRIRLIPFLREFKKDADPHLIGELIAELPGILNWAVQGVLEWQARGLEAPDAVVSATESYRLESDPIGQFIAECCLAAEDYVVRAKSVYEAYRRWATQQGLTERETLSATKSGKRLGERFPKDHDKGGAIYRGVGLLGDGFEPSSGGAGGANAA